VVLLSLCQTPQHPFRSGTAWDRFLPQKNLCDAGTNQRLKRSGRRNKKVSDGRAALRYYLMPRIA
jgi:hypothetical protein